MHPVKVIDSCLALPYKADRIREAFSTSGELHIPMPAPIARPIDSLHGAPIIVDRNRHDDILRITGRFAREVVFYGISREAAIAALGVEEARGHWTREVPHDELVRALDGAIKNFRSGAWKGPANTDEPQRLSSPQRSLLEFPIKPVAAFLASASKPDWLIQDFFERGCFGAVFAPPASYKTFLVLGLLCCVATGSDWFGARTRKGVVVYICGEGQRGIGARLLAWQQYSGTSLSNALFFISVEPTQLIDALSVAAVADSIKRRCDEIGSMPELICFDTLARNFGAGNENDSQDMGSAITNIDIHFRAQFGCAVLLVHHSGHGDQTRGRGSSVLPAALDVAFRLERTSERTVTMFCTKMKDSEPTEPRHFALEKVSFETADGESTSSAVLLQADSALAVPLKVGGLGRNQQIALTSLRRLYELARRNLSSGGLDPGGARVRLDEWRHDLRDAMDRRRLHEALETLISRGNVKSDPPFVYVTNDATRFEDTL